MVALSGYFLVRDEVSAPPAVTTRSYDLVHSMGIYQAAVLSYAKAHPAITGQEIGDAALSLPSWYIIPSPRLWSNYIAADRTVVVYAVSTPPISMAGDLAAYTDYSGLVGTANTVSGKIEAIGFTTPYVSIPAAPAGVTIPNGSPVWIASPL